MKIKCVPVLIDPWKLVFFEKELNRISLKFENMGYLTPGCLTLRIETYNIDYLNDVIYNINKHSKQAKLIADAKNGK